MHLLFITQKLHGQDAFTSLWVKAFEKQGYKVTVLCLEKVGVYDFPVISMGKERGIGKMFQVLNFYKMILILTYDRVFIHMNPVWAAFGFPIWVLTRTPVYLWYTHYKMQLGVKLFSLYGKRFFCATPQSLPQFDGSEKKIVVGHGIDLAVWPRRANTCSDPHRLLVVHRLSRSKRLELCIRALTLLDDACTIDVYGIEAEPEYVSELKKLVSDLKLSSRVTFHGSIPMTDLPKIYTQHRLILNMASETIDKTMLEAMTCGCYPVTTKANAQAIGISEAPIEDTPEAIADFIHTFSDTSPMTADALYQMVQEHHSLEGLMKKMDGYIKEGK